MICEVCESEEATVTLIPTGGEGMPQTIGGACFARFGLETAKTILPAEEIASILGPMFVSPPSFAAPAKDRKSKAGKIAKAGPVETPGPEVTATPAEEPAAAANGGD